MKPFLYKAIPLWDVLFLIFYGSIVGIMCKIRVNVRYKLYYGLPNLDYYYEDISYYTRQILTKYYVLA